MAGLDEACSGRELESFERKRRRADRWLDVTWRTRTQVLRLGGCCLSVYSCLVFSSVSAGCRMLVLDRCYRY